MLSEKQLLANQRNAQKSTGPKTAEGKARSRLNATRHGLAGAGVALTEEDRQVYAQRLEEWSAEVGPRGQLETYLVQSAVLASVRLDRCRDVDFALSKERRRQTIQSWEQAQEQQLQALISRASTQPWESLAELIKFSTGCEWLMFNWGLCRDAMATQGFLEAPQFCAAKGMRLLGEANEIEGLNDLARGGAEGEEEARVSLARIIEAELEQLEVLRDELWIKQEAPQVKQVLEAEAFDASPQAVLMRRYETACRNDLHRALRDLARIRKENVLVTQEPKPLEAPPAAPEPSLRNEAISAASPLEPETCVARPAFPTAPFGRAARRKEARRRGKRARQAAAVA